MLSVGGDHDSAVELFISAGVSNVSAAEFTFQTAETPLTQAETKIPPAESPLHSAETLVAPAEGELCRPETSFRAVANSGVPGESLKVSPRPALNDSRRPRRVHFTQNIVTPLFSQPVTIPADLCGE